MVKKSAAQSSSEQIVIKEPNFKVLELGIVGTSFLVQNNFPDEQRHKMMEEQEKGSRAKSAKGNRAAKDFNAGYLGSLHVADDGWHGIPATAFRAAMIRACSTCGVEMTRAKMCFFVLADGFEKETAAPLVRITKGEPSRFDAYVRNATGVADIRARGRFAPGWECVLRVKYDADLFAPSTVANLIQRAGISVGVLAGRPFSTTSCGQGWGTFEIKGTSGQEATEKVA
jgi:hypothetical protein